MFGKTGFEIRIQPEQLPHPATEPPAFGLADENAVGVLSGGFVDDRFLKDVPLSDDIVGTDLAEFALNGRLELAPGGPLAVLQQ